ncbi:hypothetical protein FA13DRAFT_1735388 [Coprinellus micaceus]|uniref:Uncharacterized protein n=1 Tax=Coprinellus micaceus TaxID=71717 RepID=A0A4Y7T3W7_COPMI|nr:hypothetical protein FA13DRAFT_1735388 [Coprinellus micaceus]
MLDVFLTHIKRPDALEGGELFNATFGTLLPLVRVCEDCPQALRIPTAQRFAESVPDIVHNLCEILQLGEDEPWNIDAGLDTDPTGNWLTGTLADDSLTLRLCLFWWVATHNGGLLLYLSDCRMPQPNADCPDRSITLFSWCAEGNPRELAKAIMEGEHCAPELFARRTNERMRSLVKLNSVPHLSHYPDFTLEHTNLRMLVAATD